MSGHSKWATIKHKKGAADKARGKLFAKLIRQVEVAAREGGGDPDSNPTLRTMFQKAREASVPLDTIEPAERSALIVGSEGPGLTEHWQREADVRMTIAMAAGIDSLNVAASVAIACWHFRPS